MGVVFFGGRVIKVRKILYFPNLSRIFASTKMPITKEDALDKIEQLSWEDPETFFILMANCLSDWPVEMDEGVRIKLGRLNLINDSGYSPMVVRNIMSSITENVSSMVAVE